MLCSLCTYTGQRLYIWHADAGLVDAEGSENSNGNPRWNFCGSISFAIAMFSYVGQKPKQSPHIKNVYLRMPVTVAFFKESKRNNCMTTKTSWTVPEPMKSWMNLFIFFLNQFHRAAWQSRKDEINYFRFFFLFFISGAAWDDWKKWKELNEW